MTQYIPKDALVAEIDRLRNSQRLDDRHSQGVLDGIHAIEKFINTLEVKEVDLDKEIDEHWGECAGKYGFHFYDFAKYFFELGLKLNQKGE